MTIQVQYLLFDLFKALLQSWDKENHFLDDKSHADITHHGIEKG